MPLTAAWWDPQWAEWKAASMVASTVLMLVERRVHPTAEQSEQSMAASTERTTVAKLANCLAVKTVAWKAVQWVYRMVERMDELWAVQKALQTAVLTAQTRDS